MHSARQGNSPGLRKGSPAKHRAIPRPNLAPANLPANPGPGQFRVLVVEDDPFVRGGIVSLINGQADLTCCGETGSIAATPLAVATQKPNLVLLDLKLEDGLAFDLINSLRRQFPKLPILVLSQYDEQFFAEGVLQAGARGYVMKEAATEHLLSALRMVLDGKIYLSPAMTARLIQTASPPGFDQPSSAPM
jgi:DNA-binding NarL/FixJ family response regulator